MAWLHVEVEIIPLCKRHNFLGTLDKIDSKFERTTGQFHFVLIKNLIKNKENIKLKLYFYRSSPPSLTSTKRIMKCFCSKSVKVQKDQRFVIPAWSTEQVWLFLCSQTQGRNEQPLQAFYLLIFLSGLWQAQYWNSFILVYIISVDYEFLFLCEGTYSKDNKSTTGGNDSGKLKRQGRT